MSKSGVWAIFLSQCLTCLSNVATEHMLYDEQDIQNTMDKIESIDFHQVRIGIRAARLRCIV